MARVRHVPGTIERLLKSDLVITQAEPTESFWASIFPKAQPFILEVGSGRGRFLYEAAKAMPQYNFIGLDIVPEIIMEAIDEYASRPDWPENIRFISTDAQLLTQIFPRDMFYRIYLHFSDPWPKRRHAKRRLTAPTFLKEYAAILSPTGDVFFKTDYRDFYLWSLATFQEEGWRLNSVIDDLYAELPEDNIATEYEYRFHKKGTPIGRIIAQPKN